MTILSKKHWLSGINSPDDIDPTRHIGQKIKVLDDNKKERTIVIEEVLGSLAHPTMFQVNAKGESFLISMLDYFGQVNGHEFTKDEIREFDSTFFGATVVANRPPQRKIWRP